MSSLLPFNLMSRIGDGRLSITDDGGLPVSPTPGTLGTGTLGGGTLGSPA